MFACVCMYVMYARDKAKSYCGKLSLTPLSGQVAKDSYLKLCTFTASIMVTSQVLSSGLHYTISKL